MSILKRRVFADWQTADGSMKPTSQAEYGYSRVPFAARPLTHVGYREKGSAQGRTHLRKRDYESELLERLLSRVPRGQLPLQIHQLQMPWPKIWPSLLYSCEGIAA